MGEQKLSLEGIALPWDENNTPKFSDYFVPWVEEENVEQKGSTDNGNKEKRNLDNSSGHHQ